jgi:hypothetical protein
MIRGTLSTTSENKFYIQTFAPAVATVLGTNITILAGLTQGDEFNQRNGRQIKVNRLMFNYVATLPAAAVTGSIRFIVYQDTMNVGTAITTLEVLNAATVTSQLNPTNQLNNRIRVLMDKVHPMVTGGSDQQVQAHREIRGFLPIVGFNGAAAAVTSLGRNTVSVLVITDIALNSPSYSFDFGVRYNDH